MPIQIYILSRLIEENNYPYKLKKELSEGVIPLDQLGGLTESKLYYHFDSLAKQGMIKPVEIIKEENRPDKQVFAITEKGRQELPKKIYKLFESSERLTDMMVGLVNMQFVDSDEVVKILEKKLKKQIARHNRINELSTKVQIEESRKILLHLIGGYVFTRDEQEIRALEELIQRIKKNEI